MQVAPEGGLSEELRNSYFLGVDEDFLDTYGIELAAGRNFSIDRVSDSTTVILNETAVVAFGFTKENVLGSLIRIPEQDYEVRVIGVVRDFHFRSLHC